MPVRPGDDAVALPPARRPGVDAHTGSHWRRGATLAQPARPPVPPSSCAGLVRASRSRADPSPCQCSVSTVRPAGFRGARMAGVRPVLNITAGRGTTIHVFACDAKVVHRRVHSRGHPLVESTAQSLPTTRPAPWSCRAWVVLKMMVCGTALGFTCYAIVGTALRAEKIAPIVPANALCMPARRQHDWGHIVVHMAVRGGIAAYRQTLRLRIAACTLLIQQKR